VSQCSANYLVMTSYFRTATTFLGIS
jgi:hypothetical protein